MRIHAFSTGSVRTRPAQLEARGSGPLRRVGVLRDDRWTAPLPIHVFSTGSVRTRPAQLEAHGSGPLRRVGVLRDDRWTAPLPIHVWAIDHPEGLILVDTGEVHEASDPRYYPAAHPYYRRSLRFAITEDDEIDRQLRRVGLSAGQVRWVVLTHLHTDHAGGLRHFEDAEIVIAADEWAAARGLGGWARGYL